MGLFERAYPYMKESVAGDPLSPSFTSGLGIYEWALGDTARASVSFDRSIKLGWVLVAGSEARMLAASGKRDEAYAFLVTA